MKKMNNDNVHKNSPLAQVSAVPAVKADKVAAGVDSVLKPVAVKPVTEQTALPAIVAAKRSAPKAITVKITKPKVSTVKQIAPPKVAQKVAMKPAAAKPVVTRAKSVTAKAAVAKVAPATTKKVVVAPARKIAMKPVSAVVVAKEKTKKEKLVRDSFTMPETEYAALNLVKKACLSAGVEVKKSQLLRIGVRLLSQTDVKTLKALISDLAPLKAGRPKKEK